MDDDSEFISHGPCPACGSSDARALYTDGHEFCFSCGDHAQGDGEPAKKERRMANGLLSGGKFAGLPKRKISEETCRKFGYAQGKDEKGDGCHIANYRVGGEIVGQKLRYDGKNFTVRGKLACLFGQHLWNKGKMIVITEGELDAMAVSQAQKNKWPAVSIPTGAQGAKKALAKQMEYLGQFETIILMFDQDQEGALAADACAQLFEPGRVKVARLPLKDASEMLQAGRQAELIDAIWQSKPYRPDGIVRVSDIEAELHKTLEIGVPWPWETLTQLTYGRRRGEVYMLGAGTGVGKTDVFTQIIAHTITELGEKAAAFYLEQPPTETVRRIAGKLTGQRFHVPDAGWTEDQWREAVDALVKEDRLYLYNHFGSTDWEIIKTRIRYLARSEGVHHIFIDHLTALVAHAEDERRALEELMAEVAGLAQELGVSMYVISHLATPDGKPHEEGGRVMVRHFKGSRAIGYWSHFMFGLERDQQDEDETRRATTTFRVLKDRYTGQATGQTFYLRYNQETGLLTEVEDIDEPDDFGFGDESSGPGI